MLLFRIISQEINIVDGVEQALYAIDSMRRMGLDSKMEGKYDDTGTKWIIYYTWIDMQ